MTTGSPHHDKRPIGVIGAALDLGSGRRGVDMGPSAIRYAQLGERITSLFLVGGLLIGMGLIISNREN